MKGILGKKIGMTQILGDDGVAVPVTVVDVTPCVVVQKKTVETDGYASLQVGYGRKKLGKATKALQGHCKKAGDASFQYLREFALDLQVEVGGEVKAADLFADGDIIDVTGVSKGKGFQGVMKRHNFSGGRASHGSMFHRAPGSAGASAYPSRVWKGKRYPGHMGDARVTVQNLKVYKLIPEKNLMLIKGAVPGSVNSLVVIRSAVKSK